MTVRGREQERRQDRNGALLEWFAESSRTLPWRGDTDPWHILVSEVMLQQTPVRRVEPRYGPFLARYPEPAALAASPRADLITAWGGLGYLRRAFHLQSAAERIADNGWPTTPAGLRELPGVGPYTAAAVACFAFGHPVPTVDTNLRRVLFRWEGRALTGAELGSVAEQSLAADSPADWNQAVMDLGSSLCRPRAPRCGECPVTKWCTDPGLYVPPPRQAPFEGSVRQVRAAALRHLAVSGTARRETLATEIGHDPDLVERALAALLAEGLVTGDDLLRLP